MTHEDAAALLCAVLGSENVQDSVATVEAMRKLEANFQWRRTSKITADTYAFLRPDGKVGHDAFAVIRESIREMNRSRSDGWC